MGRKITSHESIANDFFALPSFCPLYPGQLATLGDQHESIDGGDSKVMYSLTAVDLAIASS